MSAVELLAYVPIAVNCCVEPTANLSGDDGVTEMDDNIAISNSAGGLVTPDRAAVILVLPTATAVANPTEEIVATVVSELNQVTRELMSVVELFAYVPIAVNCCVELTAKS